MTKLHESLPFARQVEYTLGHNGKNPATAVLVIDQYSMDNWGIGGEFTTVRRQKDAQRQHQC
jgi:phenylpyruvate tautomerase PptA (4-oxalocrotonate tautomerase family)